MFRTSITQRLCGTIPVALATIGLSIFGLNGEPLRSQDQEREKSTTKRNQEKADQQKRGKDATDKDAETREQRKNNRQRADRQDKAKLQLGVVIADSPSGSPLIVQMMPGSPAAQAGARHGDYILSIAGQEIKSPEQLRKTLMKQDPAKTASMTVWRNGEKQELEIDFSARQPTSQPRMGNQPWLGAMIRPTEDMGVEVARIYLDSPAHQAGLKTGDRITTVNGEKVASPQEVIDRLSQLEPGDKAKFQVQREDEQKTIEVKIGNLEDFHEKLFGARFRRKFDDFHQMFDPDFDGVPERFYTFRVLTGEEAQAKMRDMLREMRDEIQDFREEFRESNGSEVKASEDDQGRKRDKSSKADSSDSTKKKKKDKQQDKS